MRLIDADKFAEDICKLPAIDEHSANAVVFLLHEQPTVDIKTEVAEVVRCKDCEHWEATDDGVSRNNKGRTDGACEKLWNSHCAERHFTEQDHYCGYGRHKTQKEGVGG